MRVLRYGQEGVRPPAVLIRANSQGRSRAQERVLQVDPAIAGMVRQPLTQGASRGHDGYEKRSRGEVVQIVQHYIDRAQQEEVWHRRYAIEEAAE